MTLQQRQLDVEQRKMKSVGCTDEQEKQDNQEWEQGEEEG